MSTAGRVPERGDVIWLSLNPKVGHEQAGRRPALVLSPAEYNGRVGLALIAPITNQKKGYSFEVELPAGLGVTGVVLADQTKSLDWRGRKAEFACRVVEDVVMDVVGKLLALLDPDGEFGGTDPESS
jgi:mRNA interferase MazF